MASIVEVGALSLDLAGVQINGSGLPLVAVALIAFVVFAALVTWQIWELNGELHEDERNVQLTVEKDGDEPNWLTIKKRDGRLQVTVLSEVKARNLAKHPILISEMYACVYRRRFGRWYSLVGKVEPYYWDDSPANDQRALIDWKLPATSPLIGKRAMFAESTSTIRPWKGTAYVRIEGKIGKSGTVTTPFHSVTVD